MSVRLALRFSLTKTLGGQAPLEPPANRGVVSLTQRKGVSNMARVAELLGIEQSSSMKLMEQGLARAFEVEHYAGEMYYKTPSGFQYALSNRKSEIDDLIADLQNVTEDTKPANIIIINAGVAKLVRQSVKSYTDSIPKFRGRTLASYRII
jgi:hypothetical protein